MSLVLDASLVLAWFLDEEGRDAAHDLVRQLAETTAIVPQLWSLEVANGFQMAIRRGKTTVRARDEAIADLRQMEIETDPETSDQAWHTTLSLSDRYRLTAYDASYLELAVRRQVPLATFDRQLLAAARAAGVSVLP